jgi:hypothetical protein
MNKLFVRTMVFLLLAGLLFGQTAPKGRALKVEDYYRIKTIGTPEISPNGKWVSFTVATRIEEDNTTAFENVCCSL